MRVLFDIVHPAHVHFYRYMIEELDRSGDAWRIVSRDKDVTNELLDDLGFEYTSVGQPGGGLGGLAIELLARDRTLVRVARDFEPDIILTRNPAGTHAGRILGIPSAFDTDNGRSAGIHYRTAAPFASFITTPDCFPADLGPKQVRYPSYKSLAFLHPNRFTPDVGVRSRLGVSPNDTYFVIRLVSMGASHDIGERGMDLDQVKQLIAILERRGRVFVSSEFALPPHLSHYRLDTGASDFHSVLAEANLCIGDSGSVIQESALLGVPSVFISSFTGRIAPIEELEHRYGLIHSYQPGQFKNALATIDRILNDDPDIYTQKGLAMLADKVDLSDWYLRFVRSVASRPDLLSHRSGEDDIGSHSS